MSETSQNKTGHSGSPDRSKSKKRDRSASEERLLKAAEDIFSKHGFKGATTRMIAQKAKVNESLIGRYFDGKMGLLIAIIENHIEKIPTETLDYPPQESLHLELSEYTKSKFCVHCDKNQEFFKIVMSQALTDSKFLKRIRATVPMLVDPQLRERLELLVKKGKIRKGTDLDEMIRTLDVYFHGAMLFEKIFMGTSDESLLKSLLSIADIYGKAFSA